MDKLALGCVVLGTMSGMDPHITTVMSGFGGVAAASVLMARGIAARDITRAVRAGDLVRIRRNALVTGELWRQSAPWERHALRTRAVAAGVDPDKPVTFTHHSALSLWGIALHGVDDRVHLTSSSGRRGRNDSGVSFHRPVPAPFVTVRHGISVVAPAAACLQVAAAFGAEAGLVSADDLLRAKHAGTDDLAAALKALGISRASRSPRQVVSLADPRIESAAESRARWAFQLAGIDQPTPQVVIRDGAGDFVARVDFLIERFGVVIEVDGMGKYTDVRDLRAEKKREDRIRELGYEVVRLTWTDLNDPQLVLRKVMAAVNRAAARTA